MKVFKLLTVAMVFFLGQMGLFAEESEDAVLGKPRADVLKEAGKPTEEISDSKLTLKLFDSVAVYQDETNADSVVVYFFDGGVTTAVGTLDYYAKGDKAVETDVDDILAGLKKEGFLPQADFNKSDADDALFATTDKSEYVYVNVLPLEEGGSLVLTLYSDTTATISDASKVLDVIDERLQDDTAK